jgi:hypothetical protein
MLKDWQATDMASDGQALRSDELPWRPIGPSYIPWNERRWTACQNRLALGAERVHSAWRDEDLPDFHAPLREPKHLATNGLRKWIDPPAGERSRCDTCLSAPKPANAPPGSEEQGPSSKPANAPPSSELSEDEEA